MTVHELLHVLKAAPPHHVLQVWDTREQRFEGRVVLSVDHSSDELRINLGPTGVFVSADRQLSLDWTMPDAPQQGPTP